MQVLYVMELLQNQEEGHACFSSISEFLLTHPVLSFGIQVVSRCRLRHTEVLPAEEENDSLGAGELPQGQSYVSMYLGSVEAQRGPGASSSTLSFQMVPMELVPWSLQLVCSSNSFVCILSECLGRPISALSVSVSTLLILALGALYSPPSFPAGHCKMCRSASSHS